MGAYKSAEELYKYMGQIFALAFETDGLKQKLNATGVTLKLNLSDPDSVIAVDFGQGVVQYGSDITMDVQVDLEMTADIAHRFWLGKVNVPLAIAKRDIKVHGSVQKVLKLAPLMQPLHEKYHQILTDAGLEELTA
jgi:ubiquinone biosynthesis protein UbiJ